MRIGVYLKRQNWKDPYVASDRIRGDWVMQHCPEMEEWQPGVEYDATIFHNAVPEIAIGNGVKILDVCDPIWGHAIHNFRKTIEPVSAIVTTTERMRADALKVVPDKPVYVIGDGHHFPFYETREPNLHSRTARVAVWFGYAANAACLRPLLPVLRAFNLTLKIIAERNPFPPAAPPTRPRQRQTLVGCWHDIDGPVCVGRSRGGGSATLRLVNLAREAKGLAPIS